MTHGIFVTGTDTGVGKTIVSAALLRGLVQAGYRAVGMKPVAAGLDETEGTGEAVPADARILVAAGNVDAPIRDVNPYVFAPPIAPELAAMAAGVAIEIDVIADAYSRLGAMADVVVVEGAGGALVPLSRATDMLDIPVRLHLPVLLVVGIRLGCINHALLSALAIRARGLKLAGWVANRIDSEMREADANVRALAERLGSRPCVNFAWRDDALSAFAFERTAMCALGFASSS